MIRTKRVFLVALWLQGILVFFSACIQLETPNTFREEEEIKIRTKNLNRYYQDLEEAIQLEQYHIKLLQENLNISLTREQALANEIQKKQKENNSKEKDLNALLEDIKGLENHLNEQKNKRKKIEDQLKDEQKKASAYKKSIALEASRIGELRARLRQTLDRVKGLESEIKAQEAAVLLKKKDLEALSKDASKLDALKQEETKSKTETPPEQDAPPDEKNPK